MNRAVRRRSRTARRILPVLALAVVILATGCFGRCGRKLPEPTTVDEVIGRHVEAIGGADALLAGSGRTVRGQVELPSTGLEGAFTIHLDREGGAVTVVELPGVGTIRQGATDGVAWVLNPMTGPMVLDGDMAARTLDGADWDAPLFAPDDYPVREYLGRTEFRGMDTYQVRMVSRRGAESMHYFSVRDGWLVATEATVDTPMGALASTTLVSDYREWDGAWYPARTVQEIGPAGTQVLIVEEVESGDVPAEVLALPREIRALLEP